MFNESFGLIARFARESNSPESFKNTLRNYISGRIASDNIPTDSRNVTAKHLLLLIDNDNTTVDELSTGEKIHIKTITYLWELLTEKIREKVSPDIFIDLYHQFRLLEKPADTACTPAKAKRWMERWPTGLTSEILNVRKTNKERIICKLITRIDHCRSSQSKYYFTEGSSHEAKYKQVETWWDTSRFHLAMAIKNPEMLNNFLDYSLSEETMQLLTTARKKGMPFFITPYYLSLLAVDRQYDDAAIRSYVLYSSELVETYGSIRAWEKEDMVEAGKPNAAGWLLPEGHNIHRRYPEVAILIPDSMGRACGGLCASCQRMYDFQSQRFNFDLKTLLPKEGWAGKLDRLMYYFENDTQIRDILITGGDAFMSRNATLRNLLEAVYQMARRKRKMNESFPDGEKYAEIQRIRLGSRLPAYLPMRIDAELTGILREFKEKASRIGISQFIIQTHFQSPLEVTPEAQQAIKALLSAGWTITNQHVFTVAASRRGHNAKLRRMLNKMGIVCYYTFSVKGFDENYAVFTPNSRSIQEQTEEKAPGLMNCAKQKELYGLITGEKPSGKKIERFLRENELPFAATDRNVLNLPAIGKSMTFTTIGITPKGKRILKFRHDQTRRHSPMVNTMPDVCIVENKSIATYLRQLEQMKEDEKEYESIWYYTEGITEPRFELYKYPDYEFTVTEKISNIA